MKFTKPFLIFAALYLVAMIIAVIISESGVLPSISAN